MYKVWTIVQVGTLTDLHSKLEDPVPPSCSQDLDFLKKGKPDIYNGISIAVVIFIMLIMEAWFQIFM